MPILPSTGSDERLKPPLGQRQAPARADALCERGFNCVGGVGVGRRFSALRLDSAVRRGSDPRILPLRYRLAPIEGSCRQNR